MNMTEQSADFAELARRVDQIQDEISHHADPSVVDLTTRYATALEDFNRAGLSTIVRTLKDDPHGRELLFSLVDQPEVMALLTLHGLVKTDQVRQVLQVIEMVRPYLDKEGIAVEVVSVADGVVTMRLPGGGCGSTTAGLREGLEEVMRARVTGFQRIDEVKPEAGPTFVPLTALGTRPSDFELSGARAPSL